ncbi:TPA: YopX family protein [Streptococcus suis]
MIPKFRAWIKSKRKLLPVSQMIWHKGDISRILTVEGAVLDSHLAEDVVFMQSTGKMDSTGKVEVFVGDILYYPDQDEYNYGIIEFDEDKLAFVLDNGYEKFIYGDYGMDKVVGNIYQNKDLADYILGGNQ